MMHPQVRRLRLAVDRDDLPTTPARARGHRGERDKTLLERGLRTDQRPISVRRVTPAAMQRELEPLGPDHPLEPRKESREAGLGPNRQRMSPRPRAGPGRLVPLDLNAANRKLLDHPSSP